MSRSPCTVLLFLLSLLPALRAQDMSRDQFRADFNKAIELADDKMVDKAMKRGAYHALNYFEELYYEKDAGKPEAAKKCQAMQASWKRCFEGSDTMEQLDRWMNGAANSVREQLRRGRSQSFKVWSHYTDVVSKGLVKADYEQVVQQFTELARNAESIGHNLEIAELWNFASVVGSKMPDKTATDRRDVVFATEQFLEARKRWNFTFDEHYIRGVEWVKSEKLKIEEAEKAGEKRKAEGYGDNTKGIDALVMPNVAEAKHALKFEPLANWDELDYGSKGGPLPAFWWMVSTAKVGSSGKLAWFDAKDIYLHRLGATKFAVAFDATDTKTAVEVDASTKPKTSTFWLDADHKRPYAMVFWVGSDREMVNEAECNLAPADNVANVYYRSASSWKTQIGTDVLTLYDDSANGKPGEATPFTREFRTTVLGEHDAAKGTLAPLLDSLRIGKGPRVPYSEFVKLSTGWVHLKKGNGDDVGVRPLNPEYVKTGKIKLSWSGNKATAPVQLVVQGTGDYQTALFDVAGGKEVEVPAAEYQVIWGRMMIGKGPRAQVASIYKGVSASFRVEAGRTFELRMGAPFTLQFDRRGDENPKIDALKLQLTESSGCVFAELHGISLACDVLATKQPDGKGATTAGRFVRFTDPELVNKAAEKHNNVGLLAASFPMPDGYKGGELVLSLRLAAGTKLGLAIKKHPLFGEVKPFWR